jgi:hypothetical protein
VAAFEREDVCVAHAMGNLGGEREPEAAAAAHDYLAILVGKRSLDVPLAILKKPGE